LTIILLLAARFYYDRIADFSRVSIILFFMISVGLMIFARLISRFYNTGFFRVVANKNCENYIVIGAGVTGEHFIREQRKLNDSNIRIVGILDDNSSLHGKSIKGIPILGNINISHSEKLIVKKGIKGVIVAIPKLKKQRFQEIYAFCQKEHIEIKVLPAISDILSSNFLITNLQEVTIDDLLGRDQVKLDFDVIKNMLDENVILVTGGGGSIGSEICRQVMLMSEPKKIIVLDHSELNLYQMEQELSVAYKGKCEFCLGSITDEAYVSLIFDKFKPDIIFHAAAYKHVPLLENQPRQAVINNIIGTKIIAEQAIKYNVSRVIMVSTDKAVNPCNTMGRSKRVAEILCQIYGAKQRETKFITTRFGNVLGSSGSVIPLFKKQLQSGGPITVTHKDIERYFMTIPEASQLVVYSGCIGENKTVFVLDMGKPIKISHLAEELIRLSGKEPYVDIDIQYTGLRPGEKMYEELFYDKEKLVKTDNQKLMVSNSEHKIKIKDAESKILTLLNGMYHSDKEISHNLQEIIDVV